MFYATITGMAIHPGIKQPLTLEQLAARADEMLQHYRKRTWQPSGEP